MMIHFYNPSAQRLRQEDSKSKTVLGDNQTLLQKTNPQTQYNRAQNLLH